MSHQRGTALDAVESAVKPIGVRLRTEHCESVSSQRFLLCLSVLATQPEMAPF